MLSPFRAGGGKGNRLARLQKNRTTRIWSEEIDSAFMEALRVYPPTKHRVLFYQHPSGQYMIYGSADLPTKMFSRSQLIQAYIHAKTGSTRTRKQIASHLQRFKKLNSDNPEALALLQDVPADTEESSLSMHDAASLAPRMFAPHSTNQSFSGWAPEAFDPPRRSITGLHSTTFLDPYIVRTESDPSCSGDTYKYHRGVDNSGNRGFGSSISNTCDPSSSSNTLSIAQRRLGPSFSALQNDMQLSPSSFPLQLQPFGFSASSFSESVASHFSYYDCATAVRQDVLPTPVDQVLHTPLQPPEIRRHDNISRAEEHGTSWAWTTGGPFARTYQSPSKSQFHALSSQILTPEIPATSDCPHSSSGYQCMCLHHLPFDASAAMPSVSSRLPKWLSYPQYRAPSSMFNDIVPPMQSWGDIPDAVLFEDLASPLDVKTHAPSGVTRHLDATSEPDDATWSLEPLEN